MPDIYDRSIGVWSSSRQAWRVVGEEKGNKTDPNDASTPSPTASATALRSGPPDSQLDCAQALIHRH